MFIKYIKELSLKKKLKNKLKNVNPSNLNHSITKIGVLVDENYFLETSKLIEEIAKNGIKKENITVLSYQNSSKKDNNYVFPTFFDKDINWNGEFTNSKITDFINTSFDVLISYYDIEKAPLMLITVNSKAYFKIGFSSTDKRLNHLMIDTIAENYSVFTIELFRYLKIINKL
jgi:hypothetical protein